MAISYADIRGEWEQRKIPIAGVVKSFISQLKVGQDLTRVSLPSIFLRPYSLLEEFCTRNLAQIQILYKLPTQTDSLQRMLTVVSYYIATTKAEDFNHKPYNPILGENHVASLDYEGSTACFIGEQISHHPPITAFRVENQKLGLSNAGQYTFMIRFASNSVTASSIGKCEICYGDEVYVMDKPLPDMVIKNTIIGKKYVVWIGKVSISCPNTGWFAELNYDFSSDCFNTVEGTILQLSPPDRNSPPKSVYLHGKCGGTVFYSMSSPSDGSVSPKSSTHASQVAGSSPPQAASTSANANANANASSGYASYLGGGYLKSLTSYVWSQPTTEKKKADEVLIDFSNVVPNVPTYPPLENLPPNSSLVVWADLSRCIIDNDLEKADEVKKRIEDKQRALRQMEDGNEPHKPKYFVFNPTKEMWEVNPSYKNNLASIFSSPL